jgi:hypothetical protein
MLMDAPNQEYPCAAAIAAFVDGQAEVKSPATVRRYVATIAHMHRAAALVDPTKAEIVRLAVKRLVRTKGSRQRQAAPLGELAAERILATQPKTLAGLRNVALMLLMRDLLARRSEAAALTVEDLAPRSGPPAPAAPSSSAGRPPRRSRIGCRPCAARRWAPRHHPASDRRSAPLRDDSSSFVLTDRSTGSQRIAVPVKTLNEIVASNGASVPEMVKIDAEGFDLKVLTGASDLLGKTDIFLVEAMVCGIYENSAAEVFQFMTNAGYHLIDITDLNRSPKHGVLWLCEFAFLRNASPLLNAATAYE